MTDDNYTELAVAIGRLEEGQGHVLQEVTRMSHKLDRALTEVEKVKVDQAVNRRDIDEIQAWRKTAEARKPPWTAIAALVIAGFTTLRQYFGI